MRSLEALEELEAQTGELAAPVMPLNPVSSERSGDDDIISRPALGLSTHTHTHRQSVTAMLCPPSANKVHSDPHKNPVLTFGGGRVSFVNLYLFNRRTAGKKGSE